MILALVAALAVQAPAPVRSTAGDSMVARFQQGRQLELRGRRDEARRVYGALLTTYNRGGRFSGADLTAVASAAERLSQWEPRFARDALRLYDQAAATDPADPEPRLRAASLLLARYNGAEAGRAFDDVSRRWPGNARALLGRAEVRRFFGDGDPVVLAESSLVLDANLLEARVFLARIALETDDWRRAALETARVLQANPHAREALAVRAALAFVRGDTAAFAAIDRTISADDPRAAEHFVASADAAARARRYAEAVRLARQAVERDSLSWRGWALLGVNALRGGDLPTGRTALERALAGDPFDLWTKNTLDLLDTLQRFPETRSPRFRFAMDGRESALLTPYFSALAEEAYDRLAARYGVRPPTPIRVEVFQRHADFSVRTVGLAGIGALGVCFGPVIAMDSPSSRDRGQFNWGSTLWHEISHSFHLELSGHRVPRWVTEGWAVLEERRARAGWGDDLYPEFIAAWRGDSLPPLSRLNDGFIRPRSAAALSHAYFLASLAAEYLESAHGADVAPRMLAAYARNLDTRTVARDVLGVDLDTLDQRFAAWVRQRIAQPVPDGAALRGRARMLAASGDRAGAARELTALTLVDETAYDANIELADHLESLGRQDEALAALERALFISPLDAGLHQRLAGHYGRLGRHDLLVREREAILALRPTDRAGAWYRLAEAQLRAGRRDAARRSVVRALEIAPGYADAQDLLLRLTGDP